MKQSFYAYLDDFDQVTIIVPKDVYHPNTTYFIQGQDEVFNLNIKEVTSIGAEEKLIATFDGYIDLSKIYYVVTDNELKAELFDGKIVRTPLFDSIYHYKKNDLGFRYTKESTKFKIWSPIAKYIKLELISPSGETELVDMVYKTQGVWRVEIFKDLDSYKYRYHVYLNGKEKICLDPYAISSSVNSEYNYIIDKDKLYKMKYKSNRPKNKLSSVIYETSFNDFTAFFKDNPLRSTYKLFSDDSLKVDGTNVGIKYLKDLGVTHIQILPFYSFDGVDEADRFKLYNWGYNPREYNVPSGLYSVNPNDPYSRINELKETIDLIHKNGLNVVMDVVYNHVYDPDTFPFEILCPGYFYVYNYEGIRTAYSGCKNDINTAKSMARKFIIDSMLYWMNEFNIDGFRMDIMGLIDFETVNDISQELEYIDPSILLYGEGWKMVSSNVADSLAHMYNKNVLPSIGFFNDKNREAIKSFARGGDYNYYDLENILIGSCHNKYLFKNASQSINYVECHDDMVLFDNIRMFNNDMPLEEAKKRSNLATSMCILSLGIPFIHASQEFFGTKNFKHNTYNTSIEDNMVYWDKLIKNKNYVDIIKEVIKIRNTHKVFLYNTDTDISRYAQVYRLDESLIGYSLKDEKEEIVCLFKNNPGESHISIDEYKVLLSSLDYKNETLKGIGLMILRRNI